MKMQTFRENFTCPTIIDTGKKPNLVFLKLQILCKNLDFLFFPDDLEKYWKFLNFHQKMYIH